MQRTINPLIALSLMGLGLWACETEKGVGAAAINTLISALSQADIDHMRITVSGVGIHPNIVASLPGDPINGWSGTIEDIPVGSNRTFLAEAFDVTDTLLYSGSASGVTIIEGETIHVTLFLQQVDPPEPFENSVPRFESIVVSSNSIAPHDNVTITATAFDPDGDPLIYAWSADSGSFSDPASSTTIWTAPANEGVYELIVSAADPKHATATVSFTLDVRFPKFGAAEISVNINTWPEIHNLRPEPTRIDVGETTNLALTAIDPDGDLLSFAWISDCAGTFSDPTFQSPSFTLDSDNGGADCRLQATVTDGRGGANTAEIAVATGPSIDLITDTDTLDCEPADLVFSFIDIPVNHSEGHVTLGHLNHSDDHLLDIVETPDQAFEIAVLLNQGLGHFSDAVYYPTHSSVQGSRGSAISDINGDGYMDILTANYERDYVDGSVAIYHGDGSGAFTFSGKISRDLVGINPSSLTVADLNADGKNDLITTNLNGQDRLRVIIQQHSPGTFALTQTFYIGDNHAYSEVADLDGDGDLDIVAGADLSGGGTAFFLNDGAGHFGGANRLISGMFTARFTLADFDLDGDVDVAVRNPDTVIVFLNNGNASFQQADTYVAGGTNLFISSGDIDYDGVPDLVAPNGNLSEILVFFGQGDGRFGSAIRIPTYRVFQTAVGDVLGGPRPEIVYVARGANLAQIIQLFCR